MKYFAVEKIFICFDVMVTELFNENLILTKFLLEEGILKLRSTLI